MYTQEISDYQPNTFSEDEKEELILKLIDHVENRTEGSILEYIIDFCNQYDYRIEDIGLLVKENKTFKEILKQDCLYHNFFGNTNKMEEW